MSVDHHLEQIGSLVPVSVAEGVLQAENKKSRSPSFLHYQSLLHKNRVQNPTNYWSSKARNEWMSMEVDAKRTVGGVVEHLHCEMLN